MFSELHAWMWTDPDHRSSPLICVLVGALPFVFFTHVTAGELIDCDGGCVWQHFRPSQCFLLSPKQEYLCLKHSPTPSVLLSLHHHFSLFATLQAQHRRLLSVFIYASLTPLYYMLIYITLLVTRGDCFPVFVPPIKLVPQSRVNCKCAVTGK